MLFCFIVNKNMLMMKKFTNNYSKCYGWFHLYIMYIVKYYIVIIVCVIISMGTFKSHSLCIY